MTAAFDVIVCGSLHLDIVVTTPLLPRIDETAVGSSWRKVCGGKGGNQAVQAAHAGARTAMVGCVGADDFGTTLLEHLKAGGVETSAVSIDPSAGSGMSVAILQDNGDYGAVIVSGANQRLGEATAVGHCQALGGARVVVLQNEVPHAVNAAVARAAKAAGATVVYNAAPARAAGDDLLRHVDVLVVNRVEAGQMSGQSVKDRVSARLALSALLKIAPAVLVTLGGDGVVVASSDGDVTDIDPVAVMVTSTHGAGDCFVGVLAGELARGASLMQACQTANARAAAFVSRKP